MGIDDLTILQMGYQAGTLLFLEIEK